MTETIQNKLKEIQAQKNVVILYACESGSRAWGFPSKNSDYDVRFFYVHPRDWYLSVDLETKRDVIEQPINDQLDISGWDLRKTLKLFHKSNPPLLEWLGSPTVYLEPYSTAEKMRELAKTFYSAKACMYHYRNMAEKSYRRYLGGDTVWVKKYFYVLRPVLAINWLERDLGVVPTEFAKLVHAVLDEDQLIEAVEALLAQKKLGAELDKGPRVPIISDYLDSELERLSGEKFEAYAQKPDSEGLNTLFRETLSEV